MPRGSGSPHRLDIGLRVLLIDVLTLNGESALSSARGQVGGCHSLMTQTYSLFVSTVIRIQATCEPR